MQEINALGLKADPTSCALILKDKALEKAYWKKYKEELTNIITANQVPYKSLDSLNLDSNDAATSPQGRSIEEFQQKGEAMIAPAKKLSRLWFHKKGQEPNNSLKGFALQPWSVNEGDEITFSFDMDTKGPLPGFGVAFVSFLGSPFSERPIRTSGKQDISFVVPKGVTGLTPLIYTNFLKKNDDVEFEVKDPTVEIKKAK